MGVMEKLGIEEGRTGRHREEKLFTGIHLLHIIQ